MLTLHLGAAGSASSAAAMTAYLLEQQVPVEAQALADYYGQIPGGAEALEAGYGAAPTLRPDLDPALAEALGLKPGQAIDAETLTHLLSGKRADGEVLPGQAQHQGVASYGEEGDGPVRHRVAYVDLTLSAPKHLSVAWAFAETEAERNSLLQAHRTAVSDTMAYLEEQIFRSRLGDAGKGGNEPARGAWITVNHYTARPTRETTRIDPETGEVFTELSTAKIAGDPALHTHVLVPNLVLSKSGRLTALDTAAFAGRLHEGGAVYQALLARELRAMGVEVDLDPRTNMARLPAIPEHVVAEFSKRTRDGEAAARKMAEATGRAWDDLSAEERASFTKTGAHNTRLDKETNTPDMDSWKAQAASIGWKHRSVIGTTWQAGTRAERMADADQAGLPHLADMLSKRAVVGQGDVRLAAARGFISAGLESTADIGAMMKHWAAGGVQQDAGWTKLLWREVRPGVVSMTTELHRDQEAAVVALARGAVADRRHSLSSSEIAAGIERVGVSYPGATGAEQRKAVEILGTDGGLGVMIGAAGAGKTTAVASPLVEAWKAKGLEVWGVAQAWRQAQELEQAGIPRFNTRALQPFLDGVKEGRTKLGQDSVVVLDELGQIGTRQLLDLLKLREAHGFKLVALGDELQAQSIEAGPVIDLLRKAIGEERIPQILSTVRQKSEQERALAGQFRNGEIAAAVGTMRDLGTAELVPGGYQDAVDRVADLYAERRRASAGVAGYKITISAPTNTDAREIGRAIRDRRRDMGEVGPDLARLAATDGRGASYMLDLAVGDRVRLFARTRGTFTKDDGKRHTSTIGDNGSILTILAVDPRNGLTVGNANGKEAFVSWAQLRDRDASGHLLLAHGDVLTIDSSQGITSDEHINAMPSGSSGVGGGKAYVAQSRHRVRSFLVGSMGAEMRQVKERRMSGLAPLSPREEVREGWANLVKNLEARPVKESALTFLSGAGALRQAAVKSLQKTLRKHEKREADGQTATTVRETQQRREVAKVLPQIVKAAEAMVPPAPAVRIKISEVEAQQQFGDALRAHGLILKGLPIMDGKLHYAAVEGNKGREQSGAYKGFYDNGRPAGSIYNYKSGGWVGSWKADGEVVQISPAERAALAEQAATRAAEHLAERQAREAAGAKLAASMLAGAVPAEKYHPYLAAKGVDPVGIYVDEAGKLLIPLRTIGGELRNIQTISPEGVKLYLGGAQKLGTFHLLGEIRPGQPVAIAEGYATAATVHRASGITVAMALDTSNLLPVAQALRSSNPDMSILLAADNDHHLPLRSPPMANIGEAKAEIAAAAVGGRVLLPPAVLENIAASKGTDWNDYEARYGQKAVAAVLRAAMVEATVSRPGETERNGPRQSAE